MAKRPAKFDPEKLSRSSAASNLRRAASGYDSTSEFARKLHIPRATVSKWLNQKSVPTKAAAERTAAALNRIHFRPPPKPPRHKAYKQSEISKIAVWASAAGPAAITGGKTTESKINRAAESFFSGSGRPTIIGDRIETIRARFVESVEAGDSASMQLAGEAFYSQYAGQMDEHTSAEFAAAWYQEMKTLMDEIQPGMSFFDPGTVGDGDIKSERRAGQWSTTNPMSFLQVVEYLLDLPGGYFGLTVSTENGEVTIFETYQPGER